jgi:mannose-6-phosphate isomerase-like protein (cupin superfamily)
MSTDTAQPDASEDDVPVLDRRDPYEEWQKSEGVPSVGGFYIPDVATVELAPWERKGGSGVFLNLEGTGEINDGHVVEIVPGGESAPERHIYEELVYVVAGHGSTTLRTSAGTRSFEWGTGSLFAIPLNAEYQHFNGSGTEPARYLSVTNAPTIIRLFHNIDFVLNNPFEFSDRYSGEADYFDGDGELSRLWDRRFWTTNFVPDVRLHQLHERPDRGAGGTNVSLEFADSTMGAHISEFPVGTYKKAHRHGPGAHVIILDGDGFSTLWKGVDGEATRCDWAPGAIVVPPENWFHQHFNTGAKPARYLALKFAGKRYKQSVGAPGLPEGSSVSLKEGGWQIEYEDEDPAIHQRFETELQEHGATCRMRGLIPACTGETTQSHSTRKAR